MRKSIAMKCTQEQFEAVKWKLENVVELSDFKSQRYLTNKFRGMELISNINVDLSDYDREIHETWNEKIFLEACGIEVKEDYMITKEQLRTIEADGCTYVKEWFPEVFKIELEVGKWYKQRLGSCDYLVLILENKKICGFFNNVWMDDMAYGDRSTPISEATNQEIETTLIAEAKNRGFKEEVFIKQRVNKHSTIEVQRGGRFAYNRFSNTLWYGGCCLFQDGIWATIIPTITKEEAEKRLGVKIE